MSCVKRRRDINTTQAGLRVAFDETEWTERDLKTCENIWNKRKCHWKCFKSVWLVIMHVSRWRRQQQIAHWQSRVCRLQQPTSLLLSCLHEQQLLFCEARVMFRLSVCSDLVILEILQMWNCETSIYVTFSSALLRYVETSCSLTHSLRSWSRPKTTDIQIFTVMRAMEWLRRSVIRMCRGSDCQSSGCAMAQTVNQDVPLLRRSVASLSPLRHSFDPEPVYVGFVVDKVAMRQVFLPVLHLPPVNNTPSMLHTDVFITDTV